MNFDIWFSERAQGLKWRALTEKYLKQPLKLNNFYVLKNIIKYLKQPLKLNNFYVLRTFFDLSLIKKFCLWLLIKSSY